MPTLHKGDVIAKPDSLDRYRVAKVGRDKEYGDRYYRLQGTCGVVFGRYHGETLARLGYSLIEQAERRVG